ncbi:MAG: lysine--tRNA ligase [Candidatus Thorarchaeota archaeon]
MSKEYLDHWLEETIEKILERSLKVITLATGKTPSGHIHLGILREIIICDALRRILKAKGKKVNFNLFLDDFDAAKRFPDYIDKKFQKEHLGKPFALIPCPFENCNCESFAKHFGNELISTFKDFGIEADPIWTFDLYKKKEMQIKIKIALESTDKIKNILKKYILPTLDDKKKGEFLKMQETWMPVMALCEKCNKIQHKEPDGTIKPNRVISYRKETSEVYYECSACSYKGYLSLFSGKLKLNWRIDWPAKWAIFKTTCEPAGKDHCVKGGAYDTGLEISQEIFNYEGPIKLPYEWLRLGERDMKTSKGIVFTPKKYLEVADPEIFRMLILRTDPMKHISLRIEELPQYIDNFEKIEEIYYSNEKVENQEELNSAKYMYPLIQTEKVKDFKPFRIPYSLLIFLSQIQNILSVNKLYEKAKSVLNKEEFEYNIPIEDFEILLKRTSNWIEEVKRIIENELDEKARKEILNKITIFSIPNTLNDNVLQKLDQQQLKGIRILRTYIKDNPTLTELEIQNKIFEIAKEKLNYPPKELFKGLYYILLGKDFGPRLGPFLTLLDREWLLKRFQL